MNDLQILDESHDGILVLALEGRLDNSTAARFDGEFTARLGTAPAKIIIDLSNVSFISSAGLRCILQALKKTTAAGGRLAVVASQPSILEIFEISGFRSLLTLCPDRASASSAFE
jgi:anti-sigma B factor antagonist